MKWLLVPDNEHINQKNQFQNSFSASGYTLYHNFSSINYLSDKQGNAIFVDGYFIPLLKNNNSSLGELLHEIIYSGNSVINTIKGNFTIIAFISGNIKLISDQFGIQKYFYLDRSNQFIASNDFFEIKPYSNQVFSLVNAYEYLLFNYFVENRTIYTDVLQSAAGSVTELIPYIKKQRYFCLTEFLTNREFTSLSKEQIIKQAQELWISILGQYTKKFEQKNVSLTLTAGFDSRMILAGLIKNNINPITFTFGNIGSRDVSIAQYIASKTGLKHIHYYPSNEFFENYSAYASHAIRISSGLSGIFRAHRFDALNKHAPISNLVFFGFGGSEIIRALYPDNLLVPKYISKKWKNNNLADEIFIYQFLKSNFCKIDPIAIKKLINRVQEYNWIQNPDEYLFRVIIPMHFGQDIRMMSKIDCNGISPYWDMDFLIFLKNTPFFINNKRKHVFTSTYNFWRINDPLFSSKIINLTNSNLASFDIGKGYSPSDFAKSRLWSGIKFIKHKLYNSKSEKPNFSYNDWFMQYAENCISDEKLNIMDYNPKELIKNLKQTKGGDELSLLPYTKLINLGLIHTIK